MGEQGGNHEPFAKFVNMDSVEKSSFGFLFDALSNDEFVLPISESEGGLLG